MRNQTHKSQIAQVIAAAVIALSLTSTAPASAQMLENITITKPWLRATPPTAKVAGGFLVITNKGSSEDVLIGVEFAGARKSEIHEMKIVEGIMKMRPLKNGIAIPAGGSTVLKPGSYHLMFMGLKNQLKDGQSFPIKLTFANGGETVLDFPVLAMQKGKKMMMQED